MTARSAKGSAGEPTLAGTGSPSGTASSVPGFDPNTPIARREDKGEGPGNTVPATAPKPATDGKPAGDTAPSGAAGDAKPGREGSQVSERPSDQALAKLTPVAHQALAVAGRVEARPCTSELDGYTALRKAFAAAPDELIQLMKDSGLRGRGGAGFPTGMKWGFIPQNDGKPHYLVVNADEGEPGTCKDLPLMMADPHSLVEGIVIAAYAIRANFAAIYIRGEAVHAARRLRNAVAEAYAAGYLGTNILGPGSTWN